MIVARRFNAGTAPIDDGASRKGRLDQVLIYGSAVPTPRVLVSTPTASELTGYFQSSPTGRSRAGRCTHISLLFPSSSYVLPSSYARATSSSTSPSGLTSWT